MNLNPKGRNRRRSKQRIVNSNLEEHSHPVVTMADQRTMAQLLQAPTEGYEDAIVVPAITADNFELKHGLVTLVQNKQFYGHDKEDPHAHICYFNKITSTLKFPNIPNTSIKLMLFSFSLEGVARIWLEKEPPRSIFTWDDLVSKFINQFFLPSKTTSLRNEITNFQQRFDESFSEAWDRFKDLLRACPHHGFSELHQLDTFYNALNSKDQDSLNSAVGDNFLDKMPRDCLSIIESKSKVCYSRDKTVVSKVSTNASTTGVSPDVVELKDMVKALLLDKKGQNHSPAPVKAVEESCVTCGGAHSYRNCPATDGNVYRDNIQEFVSQASAVNYNQGNTGYRPQMMSNQIRPHGFPPVPNNQNVQRNNQNRFIPNQNQGNNFNQGPVYQPSVFQQPVYQALAYQASAPQTQGVSKEDFLAYVKANDAVMKNMQTQGQNMQNQLTNLTDLITEFVNSNTASTSSSGTLPSNTIPNPKSDLKPITTRSGVSYDGAQIPHPAQKNQNSEAGQTSKARDGSVFSLKHDLPLQPRWENDPGKLGTAQDLIERLRTWGELRVCRELVMEWDVPNDVIKHMMFPYSLEGSVRVWYDKEPPNSILNWEDLAWERFKEMLRASPHHGFTELTQIDTFYNVLNENDQDSLNAAAGGNLLSKTTREALHIIENKSKVLYSRNKPNVSRMNSTSRKNASKSDDRIDKLADQISTLQSIECLCGNGYYNQVAPQNRASNFMAPPDFAPVQNSQNRFNQNQRQGNNFNRGNNFHGNKSFQVPNQGFQNQPFQVPNNQVQQGFSNEFLNYKKSNDQMMRNMQNQINSLKGEFKNEIQNTIKTQQNILMEQQNAFQNNLQNMLSGFFQNQTSTLGTLPSNTILNPKGEMKAITTCSGVSYEGPSIPTPKKVVERETEETTDKEQINFQGSIAHIQPLVVPISELDVPKTLPKPNILYPLRLNDQKIHENATNQMEKFFQIFQDLHFDSSFSDALLLMPKFSSTIKSLLVNKDKLFELAKIPLNENCSTMLLKKLGDPDKFLISFVDFEADPRVPLILGRSFLRTGRALIDVYGEEITLRVNDEAITFNLNQTTTYSSTYDDMSVNRIVIIDVAREEYAQEILGFSNNFSGGNPTSTSEPIISDSSPSLTPFEGSDFILEEIKAYLKDASISLKIDHADCDPEGDIYLIEKLLNDDPFQLPPMDLKQGEVITPRVFGSLTSSINSQCTFCIIRGCFKS
nr:reverse transcriptase domain-containing protein [Tanacetum cinerariifolium]